MVVHHISDCTQTRCLVTVEACHSNVKKKQAIQQWRIFPKSSHRFKKKHTKQTNQIMRMVKNGREKERRPANLSICVCKVIPQLLACFVYIISPRHHRNQRSFSPIVFIFYFTAFLVREVPLKNVWFSSRPHYTHIIS